MHEASIAKDVLNIILDSLTSESDLKGKTIKKINFSYSSPPTLSKESFRFYFSEIIKNTILKGAELEFHETSERGFFIQSIETN